MNNIMSCYGIRMDEAVDNFNDVLGQIPQIGENEILMINQNPTLTLKQKDKIIKTIKSMEVICHE